MCTRAALFALLGLTLYSPRLPAAVFECPSGDTACLVAAINAANATVAPDTIILERGSYEISAADNDTSGPNGLPSITSRIRIMGAEAGRTVIERQTEISDQFRIFHVAASGDFTLQRVRVSNGRLDDGRGAGLLNEGGLVRIVDSAFTLNSTGTLGMGGAVASIDGNLRIVRSAIRHNRAGFEGGGVLVQDGRLALTDATVADNISDGNGAGGGIDILSVSQTPLVATITRSIFARNQGSAGGGLLLSGGTLTIRNTTFSANHAAQGAGILATGTAVLKLVDSALVGNDAAEAAGVYNEATATIISTTIARNTANSGTSQNFTTPTGGGVVNSGVMTIRSSTIAGNRARQGGGVANRAQDQLRVRNSIIANNTVEQSGEDCFFLPVTSLGHNLFGSGTGCDPSPQPTDLTGNPGLAAFSNDGTPGNGHFPLRASSQAINAGNDAACPPLDQLAHPRVGVCDIGAVEFDPLQ